MASVELSWQDNSLNENGFNVYRSAVSQPSFPSDYTQLDTLTANTSSYTDTSANNGEELTYAVTSFNSVGESNPAIDSISVPLDTPQNVQITDDTTEGELTVNWDSVANAAGYYVYRAEQPFSNPSEATQVADVTNPPYTDTGLEDGERYYYRVSSHDRR